MKMYIQASTSMDHYIIKTVVISLFVLTMFMGLLALSVAFGFGGFE